MNLSERELRRGASAGAVAAVIAFVLLIIVVST